MDSQDNDSQSSVMQDWRLRATTIANDIVFKETVTEEAKQLTCWLDEMSQDITTKLGVSADEKRIADCKEIIFCDLTYGVELKNGVMSFEMDGVGFKVHQSILADDARFCVESILKIRKQNDDVACMENPLIEMGINRGGRNKFDVAQAFPQEGIISFYTHEGTGRLWACAIDKITSSPDAGYRHTTMQRIAQHELSHILDLNPGVDDLVKKVAIHLDDVRAISSKSERQSAVEELLNVGHFLNPKYCPMKIIEWMASTMDKTQGGVQGRKTLRHRRSDETLASELVVEALTMLRWEERTIPNDINTHTNQLRQILENGISFQPTPIEWIGKHRNHKLIPLSDWRPKVRLAQSPPAFEYNSPIFESLEGRSMGSGITAVGGGREI